MTTESTKLPIKKEWEETINKMSYNELQEYIADPDVCYPEFLAEREKKKSEHEELNYSLFKN